MKTEFSFILPTIVARGRCTAAPLIQISVTGMTLTLWELFFFVSRHTASPVGKDGLCFPLYAAIRWWQQMKYVNARLVNNGKPQSQREMEEICMFCDRIRSPNGGPIGNVQLFAASLYCYFSLNYFAQLIVTVYCCMQLDRWILSVKVSAFKKGYS